MSKYLRNPSSWTMFVFGLMAAVLGLLGLLNPNFILWQLGFESVARELRASHDYTTVFIMASSMASLNMGVYYVLAAVNNLQQFYLWTVPFRTLTFTIFTLVVLLGYAPGRFFTVALWELLGAVATGIALYYERQPAKQKRP
ncbi:MAG: hypothetical protein IPL28_20005 [Chloroflexi bacterium]|nr:hypothetical protein [Chloroflexota bacterium]